MSAAGQVACELVEDRAERIGTESSDVMGSLKERIEQWLPSREGVLGPE
jgi:hypothetical protein